MNCNKVSHLLSAFMDGELLGYEHRLIHQHLQRCPECQTEYEDLLQMKRLLSAMRVCEPSRALAATIVQKAAEQESTSAVSMLDGWRASLSGTNYRPLVFSPVVGLGVGLTFFGMLYWARPAAHAGQAAVARNQPVFEPADPAKDERPQHLDELTSGLMRESAPRTVSFESPYTGDLPDFPMTSHLSQPLRRTVFLSSHFR